MTVVRTLPGNHGASPPPLWVDMGIDLKAGTTVTVAATGTVQWGTSNSSTPSGDTTYVYPGSYPAAGTPVAPSGRPFSLVLHTGASDPGSNYGGAWTNPPAIPAPGSFTVGNGTVVQGGSGSFSFTSGAGGRLWCAFNDITTGFGDNTGAFMLTIDYTPPDPQPPMGEPTPSYERLPTLTVSVR